MTVRILEEAQQDFEEAVDHYNQECPGLGFEFADEVYRTFDRIEDDPEAWTSLSQRTRRCLTHRFPYSVIYSLRGEITTADGRKSVVSYVGPVRVRFKNRSAFVGALVLGDEVLLGAVPMEDMDLVISPARRELIVNPESSNIPQALVKAFAASGCKRSLISVGQFWPSILGGHQCGTGTGRGTYH